MKILAIDPGTTESAYIVWSNGKIERCGIEPNDRLLQMICFQEMVGPSLFDVTVIEMIAHFGMPAGRELFETCVWIGRFYERLLPHPKLIYRSAVKSHHCQSARAKDSNIRQALIDKYGPPGTKKAPGVTYGLKSHLWQAFAIATYISETTLSPTAGNLVASATS